MLQSCFGVLSRTKGLEICEWTNLGFVAAPIEEFVTRLFERFHGCHPRILPAMKNSPASIGFFHAILLGSLFVIVGTVQAWTPILTTPNSVAGTGNLRVLARKLSGTTLYPTIVLSGTGRPTSSPVLAARPGSWTCAPGTNSWTCQRSLPVGIVPDDTLDLTWVMSGGKIARIDSIQSNSATWLITLSAQTPSSGSTDAQRGYALLGLQSAKIADQIQVAGAIGSSSSVEIGVGDSTGDIESGNTVLLHDRAYVKGSVVYAGSMTQGNGVTITGTSYRGTVVLPTIDNPTCTPGTVDKNIWSGKVALAPGAWNNVTVGSGAELDLSAGTYQLRSLVVQAGGKVVVTATGAGTDVLVKDNLSIGDRSTVSVASGSLAADLRWTYLGTGTFSVGTDVVMDGWLRAPNGTINMYSRTRVNGAVHAKYVNLEPQSYGIFGGIVNLPPTLSGVPVDSSKVSTAWSFQAVASDPEGQSLTWTLIRSPSGASVSSSGLVSWTPTQVQTADFDLRVCDPQGFCAEMAWTVRVVSAANQIPVITSTAPTTGKEGVAYTYTVTATDADGDVLRYTAGTMPSGMTFDTTAHKFSWTPSFTQSGTVALSVAVTDGKSPVTQNWIVVVADSNRIPVITSTAATAGKECVAYTYTVTATDADNDTLTYSAGPLPSGMTFDAVSHTFTWTPDFTQSGTVALSVTVTDGKSPVTQSWNLVVADSNQAPLITSSAPTTGMEGVAYSYTVTATDADDDVLHYNAGTLPTGASFDPSSHKFSWTPDFTQSGSASFSVTVSDGNGGSVSQTWTVMVTDSNQAPVITSSPVTIALVGSIWTYQPTVVDSDGDAISWQLTTSPDGMSINSATGLTQWAPNVSQTGSKTVNIRATDSKGGFTDQLFYVFVSKPNHPPQIVSTPVLSASVGSVYQYQVIATDIDGDALTYSLLEGPPGLSIAKSGKISWAVLLTATGSNRVRVRVDDNRGGVDSQSYELAAYTNSDYGTLTGGVFGDGSPRIQVRMDADDHYAFFLADINGNNIRYIGRNEMGMAGSTGGFSWHIAEVFDTVAQSGDYAYAIAWNSIPSWKMWMGQIRVGNIIVPSDTNHWLVSSAFTFSHDTPTTADFDSIFRHAVWEKPAWGALNGTSQWSPIPDFLPDAQSMWGRNVDYVVFRSKDPIPASIGLSGWIIYVDNNGNGIRDPNEPFTQADTSGSFQFDHMLPGSYLLRVEMQSGWHPGADSGLFSVVLPAGGTATGINFTVFQNLTGSRNNPPILVKKRDTIIQAGTDYIDQLVASDPDTSDTLRYLKIKGPDSLSVDSLGGIHWLIPSDSVEDQGITVAVLDEHGGVDYSLFNIRVNNPPHLMVRAALTAKVGEFWSCDPQVADFDRDTIWVSLPQKPAGAGFDENGMLIWVPNHAGTFHFQILGDDRHGGSDIVSFDVVVQQASNSSPIVLSTPPAQAWVGHSYQYAPVIQDPDGDSIAVSLGSIPAGVAISNHPTLLTWTPSASQTGTQQLQLVAADPYGATVTQNWTVTVVFAPNGTPVFLSSPVTSGKVGQPYSYQVRTSDPENEQVQLQLTSNPTGMSLSSSGLLTWIPSVGQLGASTVQLVATDASGGMTTQSFTITVTASSQLPPEILSTAPAIASPGVPYRYAVVAQDSGLNVFTYSLVQGPSGMAIHPSTGILTWNPSASPATQSVSIQVANQWGYATQTWQIRVLVDQVAPSVILASPDTIRVGQQLSASLQASDNVGVTETGFVVNGSTYSGSTFTLLPQTAGQLTINGFARDQAGNVGRATKSVMVLPVQDLTPPTVFVSWTPSSPLVGQQVSFQVSATDDRGVVASRTGLQVDGQSVPLDASGHGQWTALRGGAFPVRAIAYDSTGNLGRDAKTLTVSPSGIFGSPVAILTSPSQMVDSLGVTHDPVVTGTVEVSGTASAGNFAYFTLAYGDSRGNSWTEIARSSAAVSNGRLGTLDPTTMENGDWLLRLRVYDATGAYADATATFHVGGEKKLGIFSLSFVDLQIAVGGLPVTLTRGYDTRRRSIVGDFGFGWNLAVSGVKISTNIPEGVHWTTYWLPGGHGLTRGIRATREHTVSISIPGGRTQEFVAQAQFDSPLYPTQGTVIYEPKPGTCSKLEPYDISASWVMMGGDLYFDDGDFQTPYEPQQYLLTLVDGSQWVLDKQSGKIIEITDPNGNTIQFQDNAIVNQNGSGVQVHRDGSGRIDWAQDQMSRLVRYAYDADGNLSTVTDPVGNTTRFLYNQSHFLTDIIDPLGIRALRIEYDDAGRVIRQINAKDDTVTSIHDTANDREAAVDPNGNTTSYTYDSVGNVTSKSVNGHTWRYTVDVNGKVVRTDNPDGTHTTSAYDASGNETESVDALGHRTVRTFLDGQDKLSVETDPLGRITRYDYDPNGNLLKVTGTDGTILNRYGYDGSGRIVADTNAVGQVTTYTYDVQGHRLTQTDGLGRTTTWTYDGSGNVLTETDAYRRTTRYTYDANNNRLTTTTPDGRTTSTQYTSFGKPLQVTDQLGRKTRTVYDATGQAISTIMADGSSSSRQYDGSGNVTGSIDPLGRSTSMSYDAENHLIATAFSDGTTIRSEYDAMGRRIASVDAKGHRTTYEYDAAGRDTLVRDALGHVTKSRYDAAGRKTEVVDALGRSTKTRYDLYDRVAKVIYPDDSFDSTEYDAAGRKSAVVDAAGRRTEFSYDPLGQLSSVKDPSGQVTTYNYDAAGNRIAQTDAKGRTTQFRYDALNRLTTKIYPDGSKDSTEYDVVGRVAKHIAPNGEIVTYEYDLRDREVKRTYLTSGNTVTTQWNVDGTRSSVLDSRGVTQFGYDIRGRLINQTNPDGAVLGWTYDSAGLISSRITPWGSVRYHYNDLGQADSVVDTRAGVILQSWDDLGRLASITRPNGVSSVYGYSGRGLLDTVTHKRSGQVLAHFTYVRDLSGLRTGASESIGAIATPVGWNHDLSSRLTDETRSGTTSSWGYDAVSNRTSQTSSGSTVAAMFDTRDRLTALGSTTFAWDLSGRLMVKATGEASTRYTWEDGDRLVKVDLPNGGNVEYSYDAQGLMASRTDANGIDQFTWDGTLPYGQIATTTNAAGGLKSREVWGSEHLAEIRNDTVLWLLSDGLGNARAVTDSVGKIIGRQNFDAWGNRTLDSGRTVRFGYRGEWTDPATGLVFLRARWMDPQTGRFVSEDAVWGSPESPFSQHRFLYANSSPIHGMDPSGNDFTLSSSMAGISGAGILSAMAHITFQAVLIKLTFDIAKTGIQSLSDYTTAERRRLNDPINMRRAREEQELLRQQWAPFYIDAESKGQRLLFHYSKKSAVMGIYADQALRTTRGYSSPSNRASGGYATDIAPWDLSYTQYRLAKEIYWSGTRQVDADVTHFVTIRTKSDFEQIEGAHEWVKQGPFPGTVDVDAVGWGINMMPGGYPSDF